ncbi:MAG: cardiolipin synthase [Bacteroidaceae bacterium]|nr:cardiolipin synthase [Bacteroidaceae bacterium]
MKRGIFILTLIAVALTTSCRSSFVAIERSEYERSDSAFVHYLKSEGVPYTSNNKVTILNGAHIKFDSLFKDIKEAKHHIHLEYFNFRNDSINEVLIGLLAEKVKEGVEVRALFDAFGNLSNNRPLKKKDLEKIRATGIEIVKFDPFTFPWLNHLFARDHRKIVVIDGKIGYIGGINVADYYLQGIEGVGEWRDMHSKVYGEAVNELQKIFLDMWHEETGKRIEGEAYYPKSEESGGADVAIVDRWPRKTPSRMRDAYANAINSAKDSIIIISPYFVPLKNVRKAIEKAIDDSIKVTLVLSECGDLPMIPDGVLRVAYKLMKRGAEVYLYTGGFNHSKVMCVDGSYCTIGSANLNSRSLICDYETNIFIFGKEDTDELYRYIDLDKQKCYKLTKEIYKKRSWWRRFCGWLVSLVTPLV